jgi:hypothetical protein
LEPPSEDEVRQADELREDHPWQLTYGEFLRRVCSEFGFERRNRVHSLRGKLVSSPYLRSLDGRRRDVQLPGNLVDEDQLNAWITASLCRRLRIPAELFGLPAEEEPEG